MERKRCKTRMDRTKGEGEKEEKERSGGGEQKVRE